MAHLENARFESLPIALFAYQLDIGEKLHLDRHRAIALARLAAPARYIERKVTRSVAAPLSFTRRREQFTNLVERFYISDRVRPRSAANRRLVDQNQLGH